YSKAAVLTSDPEQGGQYVNLYNLGENRTLVLVNGKRWASSLAGLSDMSTIPSSLIERIEVLKDGASAIYGSDAVAGVVNIILRQN
ncbi:TonB-dependent receptor plug domain-containing protein, partial [Xanthomonas citri pv. citri]|nr:TonB-dependent receptor plug domain-containing protein [Xanthomonas citri pv. citri]